MDGCFGARPRLPSSDLGAVDVNVRRVSARSMATTKAKESKVPKESKAPAGASAAALAALQGVFESERPTCIAIDAFPAGEDRLFLAVEAIEPQLHGKSASAILAVTLGKKLTFEVLHASARSAHDYLYDEASDTHLLLQGGGLLRVRAGVESFTPLAQPLDRIALAGDVVVACGGSEVVAITEAGKVERIPVETLSSVPSSATASGCSLRAGAACSSSAIVAGSSR